MGLGLAGVGGRLSSLSGNTAHHALAVRNDLPPHLHLLSHVHSALANVSYSYLKSLNSLISFSSPSHLVLEVGDGAVAVREYVIEFKADASDG